MNKTETMPLETKNKVRKIKLSGLVFKNPFIIYSLILFTAFMRALCIHIFIVPFDFAPGGVTGLSTMLEFSTGLNSGYFLLIFNLPLIALAWIFLGKLFAVRTAISIVVTTGLLLLFAHLEQKGFLNTGKFSVSNPILAAIAGGLILGGALAILLKINSSSGGTDIIASIVHKKRPHINLTWFIMMLDSAVVLASFFVYNKGFDPVLLAFVMIFVSSTVCNHFLQGLKSAFKFEIITKEPEQVSQKILTNIKRGVTMLPAKGMYQNEDRALLICIVRRRQVTQVKEIINEFEGTFAYVTAASEVLGLGFTSRY